MREPALNVAVSPTDTTSKRRRLGVEFIDSFGPMWAIASTDERAALVRIAGGLGGDKVQTKNGLVWPINAEWNDLPAPVKNSILHAVANCQFISAVCRRAELEGGAACH